MEDELHTLHADKTFYNTLSRTQQISLTRRIEFEYEVNV